MDNLKNYSHPSPQSSSQEITFSAIVLGIGLSIVIGAANVYLGLRAGMTVSASIPAAVVSMGILQGLLRRRSILESNLVQTAASAGESLAAGIIFTMPALLLAGIWTEFDFWITSLIALGGGLLGILMMIPMRRIFVVNNTELKYPEGVACAEVLRAGQAGDGASTKGVRMVFESLIIGGIFKFFVSFFGLFRYAIEGATHAWGRVFYFSVDLSPALVAVGLIVGLPISCQIFLGGFIGSMAMIPLFETAGLTGNALEDASMIWSRYVRYAGVGAMIVGGLVSIYKVRRGVGTACVELFQKFALSSPSKDESKALKDMSGVSIAAWSFISLAIILGVYSRLLGGDYALIIFIALIMIVMSFFFTAVASYIVGLVGNSNSPVSGMTITVVLFTGAMIYFLGGSGASAIVATLGVAGVVCCVCCTSGDICNDLKTGHLVGATPRNQQVMQIIGVGVAAFVMAPILTILHRGSINNGTGGIGGTELPAPQATLFASLVDGFFGTGSLPWKMIWIGVAIGVVLQVMSFILERRGSQFRLYVMPVAIGIYLPLGLSMTIFLGGLLHYFISSFSLRNRERSQRNTVLAASGLIAGESLVGVLLGVFAFAGITSLQLGDSLGGPAFTLLSLAALALVCIWLCWRALKVDKT